MKSSFLLSTIAFTLSSLVSTVSVADVDFSNGIEVYESQDGGVYSTSWRAYPMTIESYTDYPTLNTLTATQTEEADYQVVYLK